MKLLNKKIKITLFGIIIGIIISSGITYVVAISGAEVGYSNSNMSATTVQGAIDELYEKSESCGTKSNIVAAYTYNSSSCITGEESGCVQTECYKTKTSGSCPAGTIIKYKVNDSEEKYFHVLHDDGEKITMQQRENTIANTAWYSASNNNTSGPTTVLPVLENATSSWSNVNDLTYTLGTTTLYQNAYTGCTNLSGGTLDCSTNTYTLGQRTAKARMITAQEATLLGCRYAVNKSCPNWMNNYLYTSTSYGGTISASPSNGNDVWGYWTMSVFVPISGYALTVAYTGYTSGNYTTDARFGSRAVVEINK